MKPQFAGEYIEGMNSTTEEFITRLRELKAAQADGQSVRQLPLEINKYTMEGKDSCKFNSCRGCDSSLASMPALFKCTVYKLGMYNGM